jgi:predicted nucleic acid-binding protein
MAHKTKLMMVLIDSSVWIDFFAGRPLPHVETMESIIVQREDICICGIILTEILQGIRNDTEFENTKSLLNTLILLPMHYTVFLQSAEIFRKLRKQGIIVRKPLDCMIASVAIENDIPLLHNDKDFYPIEKHCRLKRFKF